MSFEFKENLTLYMPEVDSQVSDLAESVTADRKKIVIELAAIHAGLTANYNNYPAEELEKSLSSWVSPYPKPIITNHDLESESLGRVMAARMDKEADGLPYIRLQVGVTGQDAVERCLDERYLTGSVGGKAESAKCSICEVDWANPPRESRGLPCSHQRGKIYNGKLAALNLSGLSWKEYSFVNMPADQKSGFRNIKLDAQTEGTETEEGWVKAVSFFSVDMAKESIQELTESAEPVEVLAEMKKKDAHFTYLNMKGTFLSVSAFDYSENDKSNEEKSLIDETHTTINNEPGGLMPTHTSEENQDMSTDAGDVTEDILDVTSQLSADLSSTTATESDTEESTSTEENTDETAENADESTSTEENTDTEESTQTEENADESQLDTEKGSDAPVENTEEATSTEESTEDEVDPALAEMTAELDALKTENTKLKKALHHMLAERVVDAKIAVGIVESDNRSVQLEEHTKRTASSLADALRDLEGMKSILPTKAGKAPIFEMEDKTVVSDKDDSFTETLDESGKTIKEDVETDASKFEKLYTDVFMNRKKLS